MLFPGPVTDPKVLIEGVLFRARYLGSTQLVCEGQPTKATRMMQAEEAVSRIKVRFVLGWQILFSWDFVVCWVIYDQNFSIQWPVGKSKLGST